MKVTEIFDVNGSFAIVTGAASGLGLAYAEVMACLLHTSPRGKIGVVGESPVNLMAALNRAGIVEACDRSCRMSAVAAMRWEDK